MAGQGTKRRRDIAENFNRLSRVHERYRQTTETQIANVNVISGSLRTTDRREIALRLITGSTAVLT